MSGRPILREVTERLRAIGGLDAILPLVEDGAPLRAIATLLGCSPTYAAYALKHALDEEEQELLALARRTSGSLQAEQALLDLELAYALDPVRMAGSLAQHRRWYAQVLDRERFGSVATMVGVRERDGARALQVNIGVLHLQTMREASKLLPSITAAVDSVEDAVSNAEDAVLDDEAGNEGDDEG